MSKGTDLTLKAIGDKTVLDVRKLLSKRTGLPLDHIQLRFRVSQFLGVGVGVGGGPDTKLVSGIASKNVQCQSFFLYVYQRGEELVVLVCEFRNMYMYIHIVL